MNLSYDLNKQKVLRGFFIWNSLFWEVGVDRIIMKIARSAARNTGQLNRPPVDYHSVKETIQIGTDVVK